MSENEKYITYTRALNGLYVYDLEIPLIEVNQEQFNGNTESKMDSSNTRKKREKRKSKEESSKSGVSLTVKEFFESKNVKVIDDRKKSGFLWVIGSKTSINSIVEEAIEIYGITGSYGNGKTSGFQDGWYTKTKK